MGMSFLEGAISSEKYYRRPMDPSWDMESEPYYPKYPDPSKGPILRTLTPAIQVQTPRLEGPRILRVGIMLIWMTALPLKFKIDYLK